VTPGARGRRRGVLVAVCAALVVVGVGVGVTFAAFSATTTTPVASFSAAADFSAGTLRVATGSYTGDGVNGRAISAGFQPDVVIVKAATAQIGVMRTSSMTTAAKPLSGATALTAGLIQGLTATGFTLGTDARTNASSTVYTWTAFRASTGVLKVGTYTGTGATRTVTGVGFSPEYVFVASAGTGRAVQQATTTTNGYTFDSAKGVAGRLTGVTADGFTVATNADTNASGVAYHYVAFNVVPGAVNVASYAGNNTSGRSVTGVGFSPLWVNVRADDSVTARNAQQRSTAVTGTASQFYSGTANLTTTGISAFLADGYQIGTDTSVNATGVTYYHLAVANTATG